MRGKAKRGAAILLGPILVVCLSAATPAAAAEIIYPPDKALLEDAGTFSLLGYLKPGPGVTATVRGRDGARAYPLPPGNVNVEILLAPGLNTIELPGGTISVFRAAPDAGAQPEDFSRPDQHAVDNMCQDCHALGPQGAKLLKKVPELCGDCHDDIGKGKGGAAPAVVHPPVDEGDCLACHPFHGRSIMRLPPAERRAICWGCHDDFTDGGKARMHRPVGKGECGGCHLVHGGPEKKLLAATGLALCLKCHKDPSRTPDGQEWAVPHPALDDGCPSCHLPHASKSRGLLKKPAAPLCFDCHDSFLPPEGVERDVHPPVDDGDCAGCHNPHGSNGKKLLLAEGVALCVKCHDDPSKGPDGQEWAVPHPALDDGCQGCHLPHVSEAAKLLKKQQAPLCFDCHDAFPAPGPDGRPPVVHRPVAEGRCGGCHAPHGSAEKKLLAAAPSKKLCLKCHKDPALDAAGSDWAVPHPALDDGCPACHLPHTAPAPRLLPKPQAALCADCHEDKNLNAEGVPWVTPHAPVISGACSSCHLPHGSGEKALLGKPVIETCSSCHTTVHPNHTAVQMDPATGQPIREKAVLPDGFPVRRKDGALGCSGCHRPHGSDSPTLWNKDEITFCSQCHTRY